MEREPDISIDQDLPRAQAPRTFKGSSQFVQRLPFTMSYNMDGDLDIEELERAGRRIRDPEWREENVAVALEPLVLLPSFDSGWNQIFFHLEGDEKQTEESFAALEIGFNIFGIREQLHRTGNCVWVIPRAGRPNDIHALMAIDELRLHWRDRIRDFTVVKEPTPTR